MAELDDAPWVGQQQLPDAPWTNTPPSKNRNAGKLSWADVPAQAISNIPGSAGNFLKSAAQPFLHPIDTAQGLGNLGLGLAEKTGLSPTTGHTQFADAAGKFFMDRYGGWENVKKTIADDPVGFAADLSTVLTAGGGLVERAPGLIGDVGTAMKTVGSVTNPLAPVTGAVKYGPKIASQVVGNLGTHTGAEGLRQAYKTGVEGGTAGETFRANMRDPEAYQSQIVTSARAALNKVRTERSGAYQQGMASIGKVNTVLDFADIDKAVSDASRIKSFKGINTSPSTAKVRKQITAYIDQWKKLNPADYHTPAGIDALKQLIGDIKDSLQFGTPERKVAEEIYGAVRQTIVKQAPDYANVMKDYQKASDLLTELTKTLSLGKKASEDTALRKLLSTTRSNVNTNFGKRTELAGELGKRDPSLMPALAGQSVSSWTPQGLGRAVGGGLAAAGYLQPHLLPMLPFTSPRLMGEASHGIGRAVGKIPPALRDASGKVNPEYLKWLALTSRTAGGASDAQNNPP